jgi:hypothetical protein
MKRCVADWVKGNKPPGVTLMSQSCLDHSTPKPQSGPSVLTLGKHDEKVLAMHRDGLPYRLIGRNLGLSKNTGDEDHKTRVDRGGGLSRQGPTRGGNRPPLRPSKKSAPKILKFFSK